MSSQSYPDPPDQPTTAAAGTNVAPAPSPDQHQQLAQQQPIQSPQDSALQYDSLTQQLPATTIAHNGLQALQAANAATPSPIANHNHLAQQYAQSAAMHIAADAQQYSPNSPLGNGAPSMAAVAPAHPQKVTRLRRACDMCSQRKVKCDESGPPCKPCRDLNIDCTFQREMKRRGPPNKHAEAAKAAKRARMEGSIEGNMSPGPHNAAAALVSMTGAGIMNAEAIAPWPILTLLIDDFFTYIHPLIPFPHEPTFRQAFHARVDKTSREFLALVAGMISALVASFPRSARAHLKAMHNTSLFPTAGTMIDRCRDVALEARGAKYLAKTEMTVDDAATSYFLGISAAYTLQYKWCKRFLSESLTFCRELGIQHQSEPPASAANLQDLAAGISAPAERPTDHIKDQIGKRIFWVVVAGLRSMTQLGSSINEVPLPPPTAQEPYPDLPLEVDDEYIFTDQVLPQPEGTMPLIAGFNRNISIYMSMNELVGVDMCYGIGFFDWNAQKTMLTNALQAVKDVTNGLPIELQVKVDADATAGEQKSPESDLQYYPPAMPGTQIPNDLRPVLAEQPERRRKLQLEIQKANIYLSQLATRSYFVERYLNLRDARRSKPHVADGDNSDEKDATDTMVSSERELIVQNLLTVLSSFTQRNMEPNGASIVNKIRQIASTLLNDAPERKGPVAMKAEESLSQLLDILTRLERIGTGTTTVSGTMTPKDEEEELRNWASLRDYQQFVISGGFLRGL